MNNTIFKKLINNPLCFVPVMRIAMRSKRRWRMRNGIKNVMKNNLRDVMLGSIEKIGETRKKRQDLGALIMISEFVDKFVNI